MQTLITNIACLVNVREENNLLRGKELSQLPIIQNAYLIVEDGRIKEYGSTEKLQTENYKLQTILWSSKEAIFKWFSIGGVDFKEHMQLNGIIQKQNDSLQLPLIFKKEKSIQLNVTAKMFNAIVLSWIATRS